MNRDPDMRRLMNVLYETRNEVDYYVHVSPYKNLKSILANGLVSDYANGNYSGYEQALEGTYVTREVQLIHNHLHARDMFGGFILVVVQVMNNHGVIDEDALDPWLSQSIEEVMHGLPPEKVVDRYDPNDPIWQTVVPVFQSRLGRPNQAALRQNPDIVNEFVESYILDHLYGEDIDPIWWENAKEQLVQAFPELTHPTYGERYSLRLPHVGYSGDTRIVAIITVHNGQQKIVRGSVPLGAQRLVNACLSL